MVTQTKTKYIEATGKRKTAIARVRLSAAGKTAYTINDEKDLKTYFPTSEMQAVVSSAFGKAKPAKKFSVSAHIYGGGEHAQAEALRHGIARALVKHDPELRKKLKDAGFLKRDPRAKERKKFGLKKARRAPQWSKR